MSFFAELKRRNVVKVGVAYAITAWLLVQVADILFDAIGTPAWAMQTLLVFLGVGFFVAVFFAWAFELTPAGIKREHEVDRSQSITPQTGKKLNTAILALMALVIGYLLFDKFSGNRPDAASTPAVEVAGDRARPEAAPVPESPGTGSNQSIAVLPFVNMSEDASNEYFSEGLSEELLNLLAKIPELHVAARTSSFQFKGKTGDIADIARQLKVAHVLEGSVRKDGNQVRVTAQLIKADNGYHLWSETYDRTLDNIFQIQDEIAGAVVSALKVTLLGEAPTVVEVDPAAYALFLQGRYHINLRGQDQYAQAADLFRQALVIDPDYAAAWAGLANTLATQVSLGFVDYESGLPETRAAVNKALELDPGLASAWVTLGRIQIIYDWDWAGALASMDKAMELEPGNAETLNGAAEGHDKLGMWEEGQALWQQAVDHDPLNLYALMNLASNMELLGDLDDGLRIVDRLFTLNPDYFNIHVNRAWFLMRLGRGEEALQELELEKDNGWKSTAKVVLLYTLGREEESRRLYEQFDRDYDTFWSYQKVQMLAWRGELDAAFAMLETAYEIRDTGLNGLLSDNSLYRLHGDPRWEAFLDRMGMLPYWNAMPDRFKGRLQ